MHMIIVITYLNINELLCLEICGNMSALDIAYHSLLFSCFCVGGQGLQLIHAKWLDELI